LKGIDSSITRGIITSTYGLIEMPEGIPLIHVEREFPPSMSPSCLVNSDGSNGIALATKEMLGWGHRDIAYVGSDLLPSRATGFITAATAGGIGDAKRRVFVHRGDQASVFRLFLEIRQAFPKLTGIVTGSDDNALILLRYAKDKGIRIPDDLSLTGYGNIPQISETFALTSVEQHPTELGAIAAGRLIDMIEGKFKSDNFLELTPCELVRRHSVAKLPGESVQEIP
jgi:LacI family transcriptional regulator